MEVRVTGALGLCFLLLGWDTLWAFNLDTENVLRKDGDPDSLFGFSLAMHRQLQPVDQRMLLVGAPRAKALTEQKSKVTGGLYSCDMTSTSSSCSRVIFDNEEDPRSESKENQWMGVSVNSQGPGGKIVTCAHRYQFRAAVNTAGESRDITGRCYMLNQDLTISDYDDPGSWHFCKSRPRGHELFGTCQQGVAAIFDNDFHYIIFGAPGAYNWKGIVRIEQRNETFIEMGIFDDGPFELGDENEKNPSLIPAPANSYLGFSLDSGMSLTKKGQLTVVAGAPRANHSGAVVLLKKGPESSKVVLEEFTLEGEGLASSFGYDVAVLDLNGDSWQDIIVGAPQYFEKDGEIGGAVYVYVNKAGRWNKVKPTRIDGPKDSMFGLSLANLGDINQDGFQDFAVGAPNADGSGSVYIYHGSATGLKSTKAAQILPAPVGIKMFGYSLAGNMDLDKNSYPDLAVGSLSDAVFVYRARPVISIDKTITFSPKEIDLTKKNCGDNFCLTVEACFTYTANPPSYSPRLTVSYLMEADADHRKNRLSPRATFPDNSFESKGTITFDTKGKRKCQKHQLVMQENIQDRLHGIPVDVSVEIQDAKRKRRQSVGQPGPVLDANEPNSTRSVVQFLKEGCGKDNVCESKLQVQSRFCHRTVENEQETYTPLNSENGIQVISLSDQKEVALEVTVTNPDGDDAYQATLNVTLPQTLLYSAYRSPDHTVTCTANKEGTKTKCELGNPFKGNAQTTFYIILATAGISLNTTEVELELTPDTTSHQTKVPVKAKAKVALILQLSVSGLAKPSQVYFAGKVKDESAMKSESDIGSPIAHQFRIINLGKQLTDFGTASLEIDWPEETEDHKRLLYLVKIGATGLDNLECSPKNVFNNLQVQPSKSRSRRAVSSQKEATLARLSDKKYTTLSCGAGAKCVKIKCPLQGLGSNAVITLSSRLWNSTFINDYSDVHHVEVNVKASLTISSTLKNTKLQNAETEVSLTVFPERRSAQYGGVPWWIILLSVLFGLLLLALLAFLLWKCGVFDKKDKEDPSEKERLTNA